MIEEAKGVDLTKLTDPQKASFFKIINTEPSAYRLLFGGTVAGWIDDALRR